MVLATGDISEAVHFFFNDAHSFVVIAVHSFATLEVDIGVLCGATDEWGFWFECASTVISDHIFVDELFKLFVFDAFHIVNFMGGAEAIKEMQEGNA